MSPLRSSLTSTAPFDTAPDLVETLNVILTREGLSPLDYDRARNLVGGGAKAMIARGLEAEGRPCPPPKLEKLFADFIAHYSEHLTERSQPFPGVDVALDALTECGYQFAVCTNKLERLSINLLERFGLAERFAAICGPDTFGIEKPDPEILRRTVAAAGGVATGDHDRRLNCRYSHCPCGRHSGYCRRFWL